MLYFCSSIENTVIKYFKMLKKIYKFFFSMPFAGILFLLLAISMAVATFVENDYGTMTVQKIFYKSWWFELLWFLFAFSLVVNIFKFKLYRRSKYGIFIFHLAMLFIILGAAITRYISYEGLMHIKEGETSDYILSDDTHIKIKIMDNKDSIGFENKVLFGSLGKNSFDKKIEFKNKEYGISLKKFIPNANESLVKDENEGTPVLYLIHGTQRGRAGGFLKENDVLTFNEVSIGFNSAEDTNVKIYSRNDSLKIKAAFPFTVMYMSDQSVDSIEANSEFDFNTGALYMLQNESIVLKEYVPKAKLIPVSKSSKIESASFNALVLNISDGNTAKTIYLWGNKGMEGRIQHVKYGDTDIAMSYGSVRIKLPFKIKLRDFQLERYPGSHSPSSYASEVTLIDPDNNIKKEYRIYMNHVLDYKGYRFFQSSYDPDESGSILSVNHDAWGTGITYLGYFLLTLGMILTFFTKKARVKKLNSLINKYRDKRINNFSIIAFVLFISASLSAQVSLPDSFKIINKTQAKKFGEILIQERGGRIMPMNTISSRLIRKVTRKNEFAGQNPDQIMLGMMAFPHQWQEIPLIKIGHPELENYIGTGKYAAYIDFFDDKAGYILAGYIEEALHKAEKDRSKFDKAVIKVDERLNIIYMIFSGSFLNIYPKEGDPSRKWYTPEDVSKMEFGDADVLVKNFLPWYLQSVVEGVDKNDWSNANLALDGLKKYQKSIAMDYIPSDDKIKGEILYNKTLIFNKLIGWYFTIGFILLILLLIKVFKPRINLKWPVKIGIILIFIGFIFHTSGLALRWYIAGHAPWSNGYESMVYIAWAIVLAGVLMAKKSPITLAATTVLAAWIMIVAAMNWMDPQITNLVPVLKSYWLMIHVSVITASYGFLFLGAMLGLINLIMIVITGKKGKKSNAGYTIKELTAVNELSLTIGLFLLSIGTFLGGVWANESWGRYWGWDAKETWSLITIMIYAFILHMRMIKGLKSLYSFNLASVIGSFSILMTYFGVNFYLSGLHSYAKGDAVPIPIWVYVSVFLLGVLATVAYYRHDEKDSI